MPVNPQYSSCTVHLFPYAAPSLGKDGVEKYIAIAEILQEHGVRLLAFASDGDRGNLSPQMQLFESYEAHLDRPIEEVCEMHLTQARTWWVADALHALKCQRARLEHDLILDPEIPPVNATLLNETLRLNVALTNFQTILKKNDVLAVEVFAIENLVVLLDEGKLVEVLYLVPFVAWYAAISI
jgi:hypothetical protein